MVLIIYTKNARNRTNMNLRYVSERTEIALVKDSNSRVNESILTKFIGYRLPIVLIIYTKKA